MSIIATYCGMKASIKGAGNVHCKQKTTLEPWKESQIGDRDIKW